MNWNLKFHLWGWVSRYCIFVYCNICIYICTFIYCNICIFLCCMFQIFLHLSFLLLEWLFYSIQQHRNGEGKSYNKRSLRSKSFMPWMESWLFYVFTLLHVTLIHVVLFPLVFIIFLWQAKSKIYLDQWIFVFEGHSVL